MHDIYIEGGTKRQRDIADKVISFCIQRLMPKARSLTVECTLTRSMKDLGGSWLLDNHRSFGIEVNTISKTKEFIISLIHEMVHAKQYYKKELTEALTMKSEGIIINKVYWKGKDCTDIEYMKLPYEIEAYDKQETLYKEYKQYDDTTI
jgi:hypothetical protein|tara:strand:+ start:392 stop:838 length:447 start_codon:yes stop_codon:yes gene_type:complete